MERLLADWALALARTLVMVCELDGRILLFNEICEQTTGFGREEVYDQLPWRFCADSRNRDKLAAAFAASRDGAPVSSHEVTWLARSGATRPITWSLQLLRDAGGNPALIMAAGRI
jgi:PAS domain S-box-containing protein